MSPPAPSVEAAEATLLFAVPQQLWKLTSGLDLSKGLDGQSGGEGMPSHHKMPPGSNNKQC